MLLFSLIISNGEDRVLFVLIHLTRVLCHIFHFFSSYQVLHLFTTGVLSEFVLPCSLFISFQPEWFQFLLVHCTRHSQLCNLQGSHGVPCFYFLPQCSQLCSTLLCSFFQLFNHSRFFGFTHWSKKKLSFTSSFSLPFFPLVPFQISGRDPLVVVECCDAPRPELQMPSMFPSVVGCFVLVRCIMCITSCHHVTNLLHLN